MIYFGNPSSEEIRDFMRLPGSPLGCITTPKQGNRVPDESVFCADNGCYGKGYPGDAAWISWLAGKADPRCRFATAPDVVGDAVATLDRSLPWLEPIRNLGVPAALVAQNGLENMVVPWEAFDVLFLGGDDDFKLGDAGYRLSQEAKTRGKWVHMGRVNSRKRLVIAKHFGCDSVDGTYLAHGPAVNLRRLVRWMDEIFETEWLSHIPMSN